MTSATTDDAPRSYALSVVKMLLIGATAVAVIAGALFHIFPQIDLGFSRLFHMTGRDFSGYFMPSVTLVRLSFFLIYAGVALLSIGCFIATNILKRPLLSLNAHRWLFVLLCVAMGPGVLCNLVLKEHWGRARPNQIVEFGGKKEYTSPLVPSDQCETNCSYVSGEAANIFILAFAAAILFPGYAGRIIIVGIIGGFLAGLVRISQGGHFLSDVVFSGVWMAWTACAMYWIVVQLDKLHPQPSARFNSSPL